MDDALDKPLLAAFMPAPMALREPMLIPATTWQMGSAGSGFSFDNEKSAHTIAVPEFEIDAQPVTWAQFVEFVDDDGYDRAELWHPDGWQWLQAQTAADGLGLPMSKIGVRIGDSTLPPAAGSVGSVGAASFANAVADACEKITDELIAKSGKPVAKLTSIHAKRKALPYGLLKGKLKAKADFDAPLPDDLIASFEGR